MSKYKANSTNAEEFINNEEITKSLNEALYLSKDSSYIKDVLKKAEEMKGLEPKEALTLLLTNDTKTENEIFEIAKKIKNEIYGKRVVLFAPLYLSNYCINGCVYCPYHSKNKKIARKKLSQEDIKNEVTALQDMGHKRLVIETGEDPNNSSIEYILESIKTIYSVKHKNGSIRRVNINIAADTIENYKKLKEAEIGTYILFQETYHKETYEKLHPTGPKSNYSYHTEAMDRAMAAGIDDVGLGVLFGLYDYRYDFLSMLYHAKHLEALFGVGPHTISVPRIRAASGVKKEEFEKGISDETFKKIVAILRIAVPYTGIIVSTRESESVRESVLSIGVSQISGASKTSVGGYSYEEDNKEDSRQFETEDNRTLDDIVNSLCSINYIPSFCTACYRSKRVGDRFMSFAKSGAIKDFCQANSIITLKEYACDYASSETREKALNIIEREKLNIPSEKVREKVDIYLREIEEGKRDFRF